MVPRALDGAESLESLVLAFAAWSGEALESQTVHPWDGRIQSMFSTVSSRENQSRGTDPREVAHQRWTCFYGMHVTGAQGSQEVPGLHWGRELAVYRIVEGGTQGTCMHVVLCVSFSILT